MFHALWDLREPDVPRLNPDRPGPEGGAETAHRIVTTPHHYSFREGAQFVLHPGATPRLHSP